MQVTRIGSIEVHRIVEFEGPFIAPEVFFPDYDAEVVRAHPDMTGPRLVDPPTGKLVFSFHSFVVRTGRHTILVDSCLGNDKERPTRPQFHRLKTSFLADLARAGVRPEEVDYVMCTHLHWDHVGWNTRLQDGRSRREWLPFVLSVWVFVFAFAGLAYSLFPYLVVDRMTIWQAAAAPESLRFVFVGVCFVLPLIVAYTVIAYRVFWGKARELSYGPS